MLELIVLGQVPGTNIVITFNWLLVIVAMSLIIYDVRHVQNRRKSDRSITSIEDLAI